MRPLFALIAIFFYLLSAGGDFGCAFGRGAAVVSSLITNARSGDLQDERCANRHHEVAACDRQAFIEDVDSGSSGTSLLFQFTQYPLFIRLTALLSPVSRQDLLQRKHHRRTGSPVPQKAFIALRMFRI